MDSAYTRATTSDKVAVGRRQIAFVSGHIDLNEAQFLQQYQIRLDDAIAADHGFILSNSRGADSFALEYLLAHNVHPSRITVYLHMPSDQRAQRSAGVKLQEVESGKVQALSGKFKRRGLGVRVINGWHTERDARMTTESQYDILWVRSDEETKLLYGAKYRPGRVSGTQKNADRRARFAATSQRPSK